VMPRETVSHSREHINMLRQLSTAEKQAPASSECGTSSQECHTDIKISAQGKLCCQAPNNGDLVEMEMGDTCSSKVRSPFQSNVRIIFVVALNSLATTNYWNRLLPPYRKKYL